MKNVLARLGMVGFVTIVAVASQDTASPQQPVTMRAQGDGSGMVMNVNGVTVNGANRFEFLTKLLAFTPTQQEQAKAILDDEESALKPLIDQMKQASAALESAEKSAASDDELDQLGSNVGSIYAQMVSLEAKAASRIYAQLTPQQKQKLDQFPEPGVVPLSSILGPVPMMGAMTVGVHTEPK